MKMFRTRKSFNLISTKNLIFLSAFLIIINTIFLINKVGTKVSNNMVKINEEVITDVMTNIVNANIKGETLKKYSINDLIKINTNDEKIESVDYNLENAYDLLIEIKTNIMENVKNVSSLDYFDATFDNNKIYLKVPFYNYTDNLLLANIGPKIESKINYLQSISGNMKTVVKTYGINSLQIELYLNITIDNVIVIPFREEMVKNSYDILVASKIIQGEIPSIYNGLFESTSGLIKENV